MRGDVIVRFSVMIMSTFWSCFSAGTFSMIWNSYASAILTQSVDKLRNSLSKYPLPYPIRLPCSSKTMPGVTMRSYGGWGSKGDGVGKWICW